MKKKKHILLALTIGLTTNIATSTYAATLEIKTIYSGKNIPAYVRIIDKNNVPLKFTSTDSGYVLSNNGTDILSSNMNNSNIYISNIDNGLYNVEGVSLDKKYTMPNQQSIMINSNKDYQTTIQLYDNVGSLSIRVVDDNNHGISVASFEIPCLYFEKNSQGYKASSSGQNYVVSDNNGNINIYNIPIGSYKVYQKSMDGYSNFLNTGISVDYNQTSSIIAVNKKNGSTSTSRSSTSNQTNINELRRTNSNKGLLKLNVKSDNKYIEGVKYQLKKGTEIISFKKNNNSYEISTNGNYKTIDTNSSNFLSVILDPGTYKLIETQTPNGFTKIKDRDIEIKKGIETKVDINKKKESGSVLLNLRNDNSIAIKNAEFEIYSGGNLVKFKKDNDKYKIDESGSQTLVTDENGQIKVDSIPVGDISIKNTKAGDGYSIINEEIKKSVQSNSELKIDLTAQKKKSIISVLNENEPLANVEYELYKENELLVKDITKLDGNIAEIKSDGNYYVKILRVPERYVKPNKEKIKFIVKNLELDNHTIDIESATIKATLKNKIEGEEFTLYKDGAKYATEKTDPNGNVMFSSLPYGSYSLKQTASSKGSISNKEYNVVIDADYQNKDAFDFSNLKTEKKKNSFNSIFIALIATAILMLMYTAYNVYKICKEQGLKPKELFVEIKKDIATKMKKVLKKDDIVKDSENQKMKKKKIKINYKKLFDRKSDNKK